MSPNQVAFDSTAELFGEIPDGPEAITDAERVDSPLVAFDLINEDGTRQRESAPFAALSDLTAIGLAPAPPFAGTSRITLVRRWGARVKRPI